MKRSAHIVNAYMDSQANPNILTLHCKDRHGSCHVFFDIVDGGNHTGIVGVRGDKLKAFPPMGSSMSTILKWVRRGPGRAIDHPSKGWLEQPDQNHFLYLRIRSQG